MKKSFLTAIVALLAIGTTSVYGQFVNPPVNGNVLLTDQTSNVVVGPTTGITPTKLYVNATDPTGITILSIDNNYINSSGPSWKTSQLNFNLAGTNYYRLYTGFEGGCANGYFHISPTTSGAGIHLTGTGIAFGNNKNGASCGDVFAYGKYVFDGTIGTTGLNIGYQNALTPPVGFKLTNSGTSYFKDKVLIGTTNTTVPTSAYKLFVGGSIICEEVVVKLQANWNWADYVFAPTYKLMPLSEVKTYIDENSHLPGVPAACEVEENGIATSEMLTIQMKKIEELTLYLIQMEARIKELEAQNKALQNSNGQ